MGDRDTIDVAGLTLDREELERLATSVARLAPGEVLVREGDESRDVHLILDGTLEVVVGRPGHVIATLDQGDLIGELTAVAGGNRTATARAASELNTLHFAGEDFQRLLDAIPELAAQVSRDAVDRLDRRHLLEFLIHLLGTDDSETLADLERHVEWVRLSAGSVLFRSGDPADAGYFVISGRLRLLESGVEGESVVDEVGRDEMVGESGLIRHDRREFTAEAVRDSVLVRVPTASFLAIVNRHPRVLVPVVSRLAQRRRREEGRFERTLAVKVTAPIDGGGFCRSLADGLSRYASTAHVSASRVDALLGKPGVAMSSPSDPGDLRLAQLLHEYELEHTHLVCEAGSGTTEWSARVARQADELVVVASPAPDDAERAAMEAFFESGSDHARRTVIMVQPLDILRPVNTGAVIAGLGVDRVLHHRIGSDPDRLRLARTIAGRAVGLVLGGGGARGFAHIGVRRAMAELGIPLDMVGGSSIGAALGAAMAQDRQIDEYESEMVARFSGLLDYTLPVVSLVKGKRIGESIDHIYGSWHFEDLWLPFHCVSTNLTSAREVVHTSGPLAPAIKASVAIPGVIPPVPWEGDLLVDGGVLNNLPGDTMRRLNPTGTIIAVDVAPASGPRANGYQETSVSGWKALWAKLRRQGRRYPDITTMLLRTMITASTRDRQRLVEAGEFDLYLDLDLRGVSLLDFEAVNDVAQRGYDASMPVLETWLEQDAPDF